MNLKHKITLIFLFIQLITISFSQLRLNLNSEKFPKNSLETFAVSLKNNTLSMEFIQNNSIPIKSITKNWIYCTLNEFQLKEAENKRLLPRQKFDLSVPTSMNDTTRVTHFVNEVHSGQGLNTSYTGKNVIVGIIDTGVDYNHKDFKDEKGKSRIRYYWNQSSGTFPRSPSPYNYGEEWTNEDLNNQALGLSGSILHGTTVCGAAAGNGLANGTNKGMAPNAQIIVVQSNFSAKNWTLTVADACDYIFKKADQLNLPAVINISAGVQFGSHDGNDPASELMEQLLDEKPGRIIVASAGNSGNIGKFHVHGNVTTDTSFFWIKNASSGLAGPNSIYVDLWADSIDFEKVKFRTAANNPINNFELSGATKFISFKEAFEQPQKYSDTLFSFTKNRLAYVDYYAEKINNAYHLEIVISKIDSTNYYYQFSTTGQGEYDAWSGSGNKFGNATLNDFVTELLPSTTIYPPIKNYILADSLQSLYSSYISSEKVITVGNFQNRTSFTNKNGIVSLSTYPKGKLALSSSKGPNRKKQQKPDICAAGDLTLSTSVLSFLSNPANNEKIDINGMHSVNGGTSMASPVIAGIAALYLEKCSKSTYLDFKRDLTQSAFQDNYANNTPNYGYGFGKAHALNTLLSTDIKLVFEGNIGICKGSIPITVRANKTLDSILWYDNDQQLQKTFSAPGKYWITVSDKQNCRLTDTLHIKPEGSNQSFSLVNITGNDTLTCGRPTITLKAFGNSEFTWNEDTLKSDSKAVQVPGKYIVKTLLNNGCEVKDSIQIFQDTLHPTRTILIDTTQLTCEITSIPATVKSSSNTKFEWRKNEEIFSNKDSINITQPGNFILTTILNRNKCTVVDTLKITKDTLYTDLKILPNKDTLLCISDSIILNTNKPYPTLWKKNNEYIATASDFILFTPGIYTAEYVTQSNCLLIDTFEIDYIKSTKKIQFPDSILPITCNRDTSEITVFGGLNYSWNGGNYPTKSTNVFNQPGTYFITMIDSNYCEVKDSIEIKKINDGNLIVHFQKKSGQNKITCSTKEVEVEVLETGNYIWSGGSTMNGKTNKFSSPGIYKVVVNGKDNCIGQDSILIAIDTTHPILSHKYLSDTKISCQDDPVILKISGALSYEWSGGSAPTNDTNHFLIPGVYTVKGMNQLGCTSELKFNIDKMYFPPAPKITLKDSIITSSYCENYQWFRNGEILTNDTLQTLKITKSGTYFVSTNKNGCISTSEYVSTTLNLDGKNRTTTYLIYPNPMTSDNEYVYIKGAKESDKLFLHSITGQEITFTRIDAETIYINDLSVGVYLLEIISNNTKLQTKLIKK